MSKQTLEMFEKNKTTKRILTGAAMAAVLAGAGVRAVQLNRADNLGRAQWRADHPGNAEARLLPGGINVNTSAENDK